MSGKMSDRAPSFPQDLLPTQYERPGHVRDASHHHQCLVHITASGGELRAFCLSRLLASLMDNNNNFAKKSQSMSTKRLPEVAVAGLLPSDVDVARELASTGLSLVNADSPWTWLRSF